MMVLKGIKSDTKWMGDWIFLISYIFIIIIILKYIQQLGIYQKEGIHCFTVYRRTDKGKNNLGDNIQHDINRINGGKIF